MVDALLEILIEVVPKRFFYVIGRGGLRAITFGRYPGEPSERQRAWIAVLGFCFSVALLVFVSYLFYN